MTSTSTILVIVLTRFYLFLISCCFKFCDFKVIELKRYCIDMNAFSVKLNPCYWMSTKLIYSSLGKEVKSYSFYVVFTMGEIYVTSVELHGY